MHAEVRDSPGGRIHSGPLTASTPPYELRCPTPLFGNAACQGECESTLRRNRGNFGPAIPAPPARGVRSATLASLESPAAARESAARPLPATLLRPCPAATTQLTG